MNTNNFEKLCIIGGLGHVGLPLGLALAKEGCEVTLYDLDDKKIDQVKRGEMPFLEYGAEEILNEVLNKTLFISNDPNCISESHFIVVVIGTPVDEHLNPQFTIFKNFFNEISKHLNDSQHVILRSTVFPGTTEKIKYFLETLGKNPKISFCPERISQGHALKELNSLPQIVSSFTNEARSEAAELFKNLTNDIVFLEPIEAELAKLFANVFRYILFGISNQFFEIATENNLDFYKILDAIKFKYPRAEMIPGAGFAAGPCLLKDTLQLAAYTNNNFFLGHAAMLINEGLPNFIIKRLKEIHNLKEKTVGILGMAFKGDNDDCRESLSYKLKKILEIEAREVCCSDEYISDPSFISKENLILNSDIIIIGTPHNNYRELVIPKTKKLIDIWNIQGRGTDFL